MIITNALNSGWPFPDEFAPPKKKELDEYGNQSAKAIFYANNRFGYRMYSETAQFNALVELAQGRQSTDNIYKMFGFFREQGSTNDDNGALAFIDVQVLNLITKYVNRAVAKLQKYRFGISLSAVDPLSIDEVKWYNAKIKNLYASRDWYQQMKIDPQQFFPEIDVNLLPQYPEELLFNQSLNPKIKRIVDGEKTLQLLNHTVNDIDQVMREFDWWDVVCGRGHVHCHMNENGMPKADSINPKMWLGSYVENEDYTKQEYAGFMEFITKNQLKKETEGKLGMDKIKQIIGSHAFPNTAAAYGGMPQYENTWDGLEYIPVMRFYFLSNDNVAYKIWNNQNTQNRQIESTYYQYSPTTSSTKEQRVVTNTFTSVYGGTWVLDSDIVYNYRRLNLPRTQLVNTRLPIITFAPNAKEGRIVSLVAQMVEPAYMLNVAWNRMKDILAKGRMGPIYLNLTAIDNVMMGAKGEAWTPRQAIDFFQQSNIWAARETVSQYGQKLGDTIRELNAGLKLSDYMVTINQCIRFMDELSGSSVIESSEVPERMTTGTMKANVAAGAEAIEYLINGRMKVKRDVSHMLLLFAQAAKMDKVKIQGMIPALGTSTTEFFEVPDDLPYCEYGLQMIAEPTAEEWILFLQEQIEAVKVGRLNSSDIAFIKQFKNMTMARQVMANRERVNEQKAMAMKKQDEEFQLKAGAQAADMKLQMEMQVLEKKKQDEMEIMGIQARIDDALMTKKILLEGDIQGISEETKKSIAKQQGIDTIIKEAMRSRSEDYKSEKQFQGKVHATEKQAETALETAKISAAAKPKTSAKKK